MGVTVAAGFTGNVYSQATPRLGWRSVAGTPTASSSATGYAATNAYGNRTDSFWQPTAMPAWWKLDAASAQNVSYVGIAGHDLGTRACTVLVQSSTDNSVWTTRLTIVPTDDSAILGLFATVSAQYWRIYITGAVGNPTIAVIRFGEVTEFPRPCIYAPSLSFQRTRIVSYAANMTEGGQFVGRSVVRATLAPKMQVSHLSEAWITAEWDAFALYAETSPFFIADRPSEFPVSCAYGWTTADLRAERSKAVSAIANSVSLELTGFLQG